MFGHQQEKRAQSDHKHGKNQKCVGCAFCMAFLISSGFIICFGFFVFFNPDKHVLPQNNQIGRPANVTAEKYNGTTIYECYAHSHNKLPVGYDKNETEFCHPGKSKKKSGCQKPINVSKRFEWYFKVMLGLAVTSTLSVVVSCCGVINNILRGVGAFVNGLANVVLFWLLVTGAIFRWSREGRICSADFIQRGLDGYYPVPENAKWQYADQSGAFMYAMLMIQWMLIFQLCCCTFFFGAKK